MKRITNAEEIKAKGIAYCNSKNNCIVCPLHDHICIYAPEGVVFIPNPKMDFVQFARDFQFTISEIYGEQNNEKNY